MLAGIRRLGAELSGKLRCAMAVVNSFLDGLQTSSHRHYDLQTMGHLRTRGARPIRLPWYSRLNYKREIETAAYDPYRQAGLSFFIGAAH